jgi:hypothetical protein
MIATKLAVAVAVVVSGQRFAANGAFIAFKAETAARAPPFARDERLAITLGTVLQRWVQALLSGFVCVPFVRTPQSVFKNVLWLGMFAAFGAD